MLTTHYMDEAAELADHVGIMDHGHVLALDTPEALTLMPGTSTLEIDVRINNREDLIERLRQLPGVERVEGVGEAESDASRVRIYASVNASQLVADVALGVSNASGDLLEVRLGTPSLEDVFIALTGRALR